MGLGGSPHPQLGGGWVAPTSLRCAPSSSTSTLPPGTPSQAVVTTFTLLNVAWGWRKGGSRRVPPEPGGGGGGGGPAAPSSPRGRSRCGGSAGRGRPPLRRGPGGPAGSSAPGTRRCHSPTGTERGGLWQGTPPQPLPGGVGGLLTSLSACRSSAGCTGSTVAVPRCRRSSGGSCKVQVALGRRRAGVGVGVGGAGTPPPGPPAGEGGSRCQPGRV